MVVLHEDQVFEFKMADVEVDREAAARLAIGQIREKGYADKHRDPMKSDLGRIRDNLN